jgi:hypothetical protein
MFVALGIAFVSVVALLTGLSPDGAVLARQAVLQIAELDCKGSPELVVITNTGTEPQNLTGWKLESDPPTLESLALAPLGTILPNQSILIESGPASAAAFKWSSQNVFRDGDETDYVRIVDATGTTVQQVACATAATPTPTPTATSTATATPLTGIVPDGGGPPAASIDLPSSTLVAALGGSLAAGGLVILISPQLAALFASRRRSRATSPTETLIAPTPVAVAVAVMQNSKRRQSSSRPYLLVCVAGLSIVALTVLLLQPGDKR